MGFGPDLIITTGRLEEVTMKNKAHTKISTLTRMWTPQTWKYEFLEKFSIFLNETSNMSLSCLFWHILISIKLVPVLYFESISFLFWRTTLQLSCD